jgi:hypothetical protein
MICSAKPVLTEDLYIVQKKEFPITCCKCDTYSCRKAKYIHETNPSSRQTVCYIGIITANAQLKKSLVVSLKGLNVKTN